MSNPLLHGSDVLAVQHLLTAKGFPCAADGWFGPETAAACVQAKKHLGYVVADQVPSCGQKLVDALEAAKPFPPTPLAAPRVRYLAQLKTFLAQKSNWDYTPEWDPDVRPIPHKGHVGRVRTDCSGGVTYAAELADCPDPNGKIGGREFSGYGYTGTIYSHCQHITRPMLKVADLVGFGYRDGHHITAVLEVGADPLLWSHGHQGDPSAVRLSVMASEQARTGHPGVLYLRWLA